MGSWKQNDLLRKRKRSAGVALFVSLVLLLMLTIVGVSTVQTTTLEVRMARNEHDSMLAFQAAELALRDGEAAAMLLAPTASFEDSGANGLWTLAAMGQPDRWQLADVWAPGGGRSIEAHTPMQGKQRPPRYIIEYLTTVLRDSGGYQSLMAEPQPDDQIQVYRITARGVGASEKAVVMLQSTFGVPAGSAGEMGGLHTGRLSWRQLDNVY